MIVSSLKELPFCFTNSAASQYFNEQLQKTGEQLLESPALTDSKANAMDYNDEIRTIFGLIEEKKHILKGIKEHFSVEEYFILKNTLILPSCKVNAYAGSNRRASSIEAAYPDLYYLLMNVRQEICEPNNIPLYLVAGTKGLAELATFLPQKLEDMLLISGFGEKNISKYGQQFLDVILTYCERHELPSRISEKQKQKKKTKEAKVKKEPKPDTKKVTFDLYKEGLEIDDIANQRQLTRTTIENHLSYYVKAKEIPLRDFVSEEKEEKIKALMEKETKMSDIFAALNGEVSYSEIKMVMAAANK